MNELAKNFGELDVTYGPVQEYLGMKLEIKDRKIYIDMSEQVDELVEFFDEEHDSVGAALRMFAQLEFGALERCLGEKVKSIVVLVFPMPHEFGATGFAPVRGERQPLYPVSGRVLCLQQSGL